MRNVELIRVINVFQGRHVGSRALNARTDSVICRPWYLDANTLEVLHGGEDHSINFPVEEGEGISNYNQHHSCRSHGLGNWSELPRVGILLPGEIQERICYLGSANVSLVHLGEGIECFVFGINPEEIVRSAYLTFLRKMHSRNAVQPDNTELGRVELVWVLVVDGVGLESFIEARAAPPVGEERLFNLRVVVPRKNLDAVRERYSVADTFHDRGEESVISVVDGFAYLLYPHEAGKRSLNRLLTN